MTSELRIWMEPSSEKFPENQHWCGCLMLQLRRRECIARDGIDGNETVMIITETVWG